MKGLTYGDLGQPIAKICENKTTKSVILPEEYAAKFLLGYTMMDDPEHIRKMREKDPNLPNDPKLLKQMYIRDILKKVVTDRVSNQYVPPTYDNATDTIGPFYPTTGGMGRNRYQMGRGSGLYQPRYQ